MTVTKPGVKLGGKAARTVDEALIRHGFQVAVREPNGDLHHEAPTSAAPAAACWTSTRRGAPCPGAGPALARLGHGAACRGHPRELALITHPAPVRFATSAISRRRSCLREVR